MSKATCEQCLRADGTPYEFHYGRARPVDDPDTAPYYHASAYPGAPLAPWTDRYQLGGIETVMLCRRCLARARARRAARVVLREWSREPLVAVGYLAWVVALGVWAWQGDWSSLALGLAIGLAVTAVVYGVTYVILHDDEFARHLAVDLHQEKLRNDGWDTFWTDNELKFLTPH
jgi:hypothetical protein